MPDPDILSWCAYGQSCKQSLCNLWEQNEGECLIRLKLLLEIKVLKLQGQNLILKLRRKGK